MSAADPARSEKAPSQNADDGAAARPQSDLTTRLARFDRFEAELVRKASQLLGANSSLSHADFFVVGATRRTLAKHTDSSC
jgi:hypothetical protein